MENSYSVFRKEIILIKELYSETIKSYNFYYTEIHEDEDWKKTKGFKSNLEYNLRELLHIRLISILEIYLVENVRYILTRTKTPFKNDLVFEIQFQELTSYKSLTDLWNKIINKECRRLSSEGFEKVVKYYKLKFSIDLLNAIPSRNTMFEFHDRRHLFVHKLGKTDSAYRKRYKTSKIGLSINETYLLTAIEHLLIFGEEINNLTIKYLSKFSEIPLPIERHRLEIWLKLKANFNQIEKFQNNYSFWFNDKLFVINELVENFNVDENGNLKIYFYSTVQSDIIRYYFDNLKKWRKITDQITNVELKGKITNSKKKILKEKIVKQIQETKKVEITTLMIEDVRKLLMTKNSAKIGIHKDIAEEIGISNKVAWRIISIIHAEKM